MVPVLQHRARRLHVRVVGVAQQQAQARQAALHHVAPELFRGAEPTPATDVYEIGLLLGWMLAGHPPFDGVGWPKKRSNR